MSARVLLAAALASFAAGAQEVNLAQLDAAPNHFHLRTGADFGLVAAAGYERAMTLLDRTVLIGGDLTVPAGGLDLADFRLRATALAPIVAGERWKLAASVAPTLRGTSDAAARLVDAGLDLGATGGYYAPAWFAALETGFDWALATHVTHRDAYRQLVYGSARDGWYANPGGVFRAGLQAGASFSRFDLVLRAGKLVDRGGNAPTLPFYATLALDTRW